MPHSARRIMNIVGARPNMVKMAPLIAEMARHPGLHPILVHTGQHYDYAMSQAFFEQLRLPNPDYNLGVGSAPQHVQIAAIIRRFGDLIRSNRPDMVVVAGDVNSTLACALVAAQERIPLAHVESGLRSFDRTMPEEINRILTDAVSDLLFTTEESANHNLTQEGIAPARIHFVGNLMIDSLIGALELARRSPLSAQLGLAPHSYAVLTLHRPSNVDDVDQLTSTLSALLELAGRLPILFPAHPRTRARIAEARIHSVRCWTQGRIAEPGLWMMPPASYLDFLGIVEQSALVITDSGGIQEETTWLGIPCLTFRDSTERPATVSMGSNRWSEPTRGAFCTWRCRFSKTGPPSEDSPLRPALRFGTALRLRASSRCCANMSGRPFHPGKPQQISLGLPLSHSSKTKCDRKSTFQHPQRVTFAL